MQFIILKLLYKYGSVDVTNFPSKCDFETLVNPAMRFCSLWSLQWKASASYVIKQSVFFFCQQENRLNVYRFVLVTFIHYIGFSNCVYMYVCMCVCFPFPMVKTSFPTDQIKENDKLIYVETFSLSSLAVFYITAKQNTI